MNKALAIGLVICAACNPAVAKVYPHVPVATYVLSASPGGNLSFGENHVNTTKVLCPENEASCTLAMSAMEEVCSANGAVVGYNIFALVDGVQVNPGAEGSTNPAALCNATTWLGDIAVGPGKHSVMLMVDILTSGQSPMQGPVSLNYTITTP